MYVMYGAQEGPQIKQTNLCSRSNNLCTRII